MGASVPAAGLKALDRWPLVGRGDEISFSRDVIAAGGSIVVAGDSGVGKTRLALELIASARSEGRRTEWAAATHAARSIPLGALAHLVPADAVGGGREATLRAVIESLDRHRDGKWVLGVDDAHLVDGVSAVLVHQLVARGIASAVVTVRTGEPVPDPILALWKDELAVRVEIQPLSQAEVSELLTAILGGPIDRAALHVLAQWTAGNVLFLRELVLQGLERGSLRADEDLWHWVGPLEPGPRLRDLVASRLGSLDDVERDALEVLAVGEPVPNDCLSDLFSPELVTRLERRGLVRSRREAGGVQVRLAHPLFGEVVRADASAVRVDEVRRRLADAFLTHDDAGHNQLLRVATWRAEIGDESDPHVLVAGARRAWAVGEAGLAERLARMAFTAGPDFEAGYLLGEALADQGRFDDAVAAWSSVEDLPASDKLRAALATGLGGILVWALNRRGDGDEAVQRAAARVTDRAAKDELDAFRALIRVTSAETSGQAVNAATTALQDRGLSEPARARATLAAIVAWTAAGQLELAVRETDTAVAIADKHSGELPAVGVLLRMAKARALSLAGRLDEAESVTANGYSHALEHGDDASRARWCLISGLIALLRGHARSAMVQLQEGELVLGEQDGGFLRGLLTYLSMAAALLGDVELGSRALRKAHAASASLGRLWDMDLARARGWVSMARGERSTAERDAREAASTAARGEQWLFEALALHDLARFGRPDAAVGRLHELAEVVDGRLVPELAAHAEGLARSDGVMLDAAGAEFADMGLDLYAAEAAAAATAAHRAEGRRTSAAASANKADAFMTRCDGATTSALAWADHEDDLTAREREVATLAARGLSNQEVAEQLFVSVRTVHAHLRSAYAKLGVSGRNELAEVLGTEPTPNE